jgi:pimeloyl-ACP methyl ester carboxylesterase
MVMSATPEFRYVSCMDQRCLLVLRTSLLSALLVALTALGAPVAADAQVRPSFFDQPSEVRVIGGNPAPGETLPVVVFLAATNGTSAGQMEWLGRAVPFQRYIAVLPPGQPTTAHYLPRFGSYVGWMEDRLDTDLTALRARLPVDATRIYLCGFSLGGDTSWALLARRPELYRGAVVIGARSSARARGNALETMRTRGVRVAFAIGQDDDATRRTGIERTHQSMVTARVPSRLDHYAGTHTLPTDPALLTTLFSFVMAPPP